MFSIGGREEKREVATNLRVFFFFLGGVFSLPFGERMSDCVKIGFPVCATADARVTPDSSQVFVIAVGGGGASNTGVKNGFVILRVTSRLFPFFPHTFLVKLRPVPFTRRTHNHRRCRGSVPERGCP